MRVRRCAPLMVCGLVLVVGSTRELRAAPPVSLDDKVITANRELDRRLLEAHERKDAAMVESLFANSPDAFFIGPGGMLHKGRDAIRESFAQFFASLDTIRGEIQDISYLPAGDGVIAVGTVVYHRKPRNGPPDERTVVWTDFRRKEGDKWVYLFRHAHWPMAANNLAFVPK
ncbi:MAG: hypothetical protein DMF80_07805 [Acidobacteria bacterium]|nr:MAG: hypothetical protein DMF80_07805 [Acidobacteriota bacterium]PYQ23853.1 MAG: hypothetical protein DMF81_07430 [Acidobacteriota bacterium]